MYYKLNPNIALRSWLDVPYAVCDLSIGRTQPITETQFQALSFCDGNTDIDSFFVLPIHKKAIKFFKENNFIEKSEKKIILHENQKFKSFDNEYVDIAHWSITGKCNFKCRHCYLSAPQAKYGELSHQQCLDIIEQLADCGIMSVNLTGGEPLVRKDFFELVDALISKNIVIGQIYTNGALVNEDLLDKLEERGIKPEFSLSFDGIGWHDWIRGIDGAEKMAIDAFKLLHKRGFPLDAEMCLHKHNFDKLEDSVNLLAELGVGSLKTNPVGNSGEWINENGKHDLTREELFDVYLDYIPKFLKAGSPLSLHLGGFFYCKKGSTKYLFPAEKFDGTEKVLDYTVCNHAKNVMYIAPDGQLLPCIALGGVPLKDEKTYITKIPLKEALKSSHYLSLVSSRLSDLLKENSECANCEHKYTCGGGCRASGVMTNGSYFACDAAICDIYKKGYIEKIKKVADDAIQTL